MYVQFLGPLNFMRTFLGNQDATCEIKYEVIFIILFEPNFMPVRISFGILVRKYISPIMIVMSQIILRSKVLCHYFYLHNTVEDERKIKNFKLLLQHFYKEME